MKVCAGLEQNVYINVLHRLNSDGKTQAEEIAKQAYCVLQRNEIIQESWKGATWNMTDNDRRQLEEDVNGRWERHNRLIYREQDRGLAHLNAILKVFHPLILAPLNANSPLVVLDILMRIFYTALAMTCIALAMSIHLPTEYLPNLMMSLGVITMSIALFAIHLTLSVPFYHAPQQPTLDTRDSPSQQEPTEPNKNYYFFHRCKEVATRMNCLQTAECTGSM